MTLLADIVQQAASSTSNRLCIWAFACGEVTKLRPIRIRLTNRVEKVNRIFISGGHQGNVFWKQTAAFYWRENTLRLRYGHSHLQAQHWPNDLFVFACLENCKLYNAVTFVSKVRKREKVKIKEKLFVMHWHGLDQHVSLD